MHERPASPPPTAGMLGSRERGRDREGTRTADLRRGREGGSDPSTAERPLSPPSSPLLLRPISYRVLPEVPAAACEPPCARETRQSRSSATSPRSSRYQTASRTIA